jgi:hypothetical protein
VRLSTALVATAVLLASSAGAQAQLPKGENFLVSPPQGLKSVTATRTGKVSKGEFIPENEDLSNWSRMATVTVYYEMKKANPQTMVTRTLETWQKMCGQFASEPNAKPLKEFGYDVFASTMLCVSPDKSKAPPGLLLRDQEFMMMKVIAGRDSTYVVQIAWHGGRDEDNPMLKPGPIRDDFLAFMHGARLCDTRRTGEQACPNLTK